MTEMKKNRYFLLLFISRYTQPVVYSRRYTSFIFIYLSHQINYKSQTVLSKNGLSGFGEDSEESLRMPSTSNTGGGLRSNILGPAKTIPMAPMGEVMRIPSTAMVRIYCKCLENAL